MYWRDINLMVVLSQIEAILVDAPDNITLQYVLMEKWPGFYRTELAPHLQSAEDGNG